MPGDGVEKISAATAMSKTYNDLADAFIQNNVQLIRLSRG